MYHDFSIKEYEDGRLEVVDPPALGAQSAFSLELLATFDRGVSVDHEGRLIVVGLAFKPIKFDGFQGRLDLLICERVV